MLAVIPAFGKMWLFLKGDSVGDCEVVPHSLIKLRRLEK